MRKSCFSYECYSYLLHSFLVECVAVLVSATPIPFGIHFYKLQAACVTKLLLNFACRPFSLDMVE